MVFLHSVGVGMPIQSQPTVKKINTKLTRYFHDTFRSLRHRNYRLFFFGQSISLIGTWLQNTALAWLVYSITRDSRALGVMGFLGAVPILFLGVFAGTIADEFPKRKILIITQTLLGVFAFLLAFFVWQNYSAGSSTADIEPAHRGIVLSGPYE